MKRRTVTPARMREHQESLGMTRAEMADALGVQYETVNRWFRHGAPAMVDLALSWIGHARSCQPPARKAA
jgi:DNA-binding XRE family transcriptional regulator